MKTRFSRRMVLARIATWFFGLSAAGLLGAAASADAQTTLYVSGTMHIESDPARWPDPDAFLAFFARATAAGHSADRATGMRWSVGADIRWLREEPRAAEMIAATELLGVQWDIHAHAASDRANCYAKIRDLGGRPNRVASGLIVTEIDALRRTTYASDGTAWRAAVLWGLVESSGHGPGADDRAFGVWRPKSSTEWKRHSLTGSLIAVGGGDRTLDGTSTFALALATGTAGRGEPVSSATINVAPQTLLVVDTTDGIDEIETWAADMALLDNVELATINETAAAWVAAGGVPSRW